ncbi:MAG: hypothetical protein H0X25_12165 [Acidobacteriales bacterium]|nr:hypothetical protein [Terriglobales bacterium]
MEIVAPVDRPARVPIQLETQMPTAASTIGSTRDFRISWNEPRPTVMAPAVTITAARGKPAMVSANSGTAIAASDRDAERA